MGKLVDLELANVRIGDLAIHETSYLADLEGDHAAPILNSLQKLSSTFCPGCGNMSTSAYGAASLTAPERNAANRNSGLGNHQVFMVGRRGKEALCRGGQETAMNFGTDHRNEGQIDACMATLHVQRI
jgi:hypothetical protein